MTPTRKRAHPNAPEPMLRISAAAQAAGVHAQTIEYYIMVGLVKPLRQPGKTGRYFSRQLVRRIRLIHDLNQTGYTLRAIREIYMAHR
ncbi:MAG: MerR family transcriptional regulator [Planctomycetota bacterium]|nr:MerR family transcriptional regulator [Planctomycetota bacterium]